MQCPVCSTEYQTIRCPRCGYDPSDDYESYPTLFPVPGSAAALSQRRAIHRSLFRCPGCGSTLFSYRPEEGILQCADCRYLHQIEMKVQELREADPGIMVFGRTIAVGNGHLAILRPDGRVAAFGENDDGKCNTESWTDIVEVSAGVFHTVGLRRDGTVVAVGDNRWKQCNVESWRDIVSIAAGVVHTVGLRRDGTIVRTGLFVNDFSEVRDWKGITAISAGFDFAVGLYGNLGFINSEQYEVGSWRNMTAVAAGWSHVVGLQRDGRVVAAGKNDTDQCNTESWSDMIAIAAGEDHTVGLRSNGTVAATGPRRTDYTRTGSWRNIVAIAAGCRCTAGLKADGTVVTAGFDAKIPEHTRAAIPGSTIGWRFRKCSPVVQTAF